LGLSRQQQLIIYLNEFFSATLKKNPTDFWRPNFTGMLKMTDKNLSLDVQLAFYSSAYHNVIEL